MRTFSGHILIFLPTYVLAVVVFRCSRVLLPSALRINRRSKLPLCGLHHVGCRCYFECSVFGFLFFPFTVRFRVLDLPIYTLDSRGQVRMSFDRSLRISVMGQFPERCSSGFIHTLRKDACKLWWLQAFVGLDRLRLYKDCSELLMFMIA